MCVCVGRFGSHELKTEFLLPSILGDKVACLGVSEVGAGSDVSSTSLGRSFIVFNDLTVSFHQH